MFSYFKETSINLSAKNVNEIKKKGKYKSAGIGKIYQPTHVYKVSK